MDAIFDHAGPAPCPQPFNLAGHVLGKASGLAGKTALKIVSAEAVERWSYGALEQAVRGTATGFLQRGLSGGDLVLLRLGNTVEFPIAFLAAISVGLVPVPLSAQLTGSELSHILDELCPRAVVLDPELSGPELEPDRTGDTNPMEVISVQTLREMQALPAAAYVMGSPERLAYLIFTSGTSGRPRAVMHAHRSIWAREMMHRDWLDLGPEDRILHAGAFNWSFTLGTGLMDPWRMGATALIPAPGTHPQDLPALLRQHKASVFAAVPGVYRKLLQSHAQLDLPDLRHGVAAGESLSQKMRDDWALATQGGLIHEAFGMSECSTFLSASPAAPAAPGHLGRPQSGRRVAIMGPEGPVAFGQEGEIAIHRSDPGLMLGYYNAPEDTRARYRGDWFMTGDHASMASDGQIKFSGRHDDMMNAGGYRVSPLEIESAMAGHTAIKQIGVTEVEVKTDTKIIVAFYTADMPVPTEALERYAASKLARYKQPRAWVHLDHLPTNPNGKLARKQLALQFPSADR
ncbi:MAG: acyl--CoA ligase [Thalassovita sp.]